MSRAARRRRRLQRATEAPEITLDDVRVAVDQALVERFRSDDDEVWVWVRDCSLPSDDAWAVYELSGPGVEGDAAGMFRVTYSIDDKGVVTLGDDAVKVDEEYVEVTESVDHVPGRVLESRPNDGTGGRVFAVQIVEHGTSRNGRRYPAAVLSEAARLYEGAKSFDHHRTPEELSTSTIDGLVGHFENVHVNPAGLEGDLHLLPGATHAAEALDASLRAQKAGLPPTVGISHDVLANFRPVVEGTSRYQEATQIVSVLSADVVADPSAGGRPIRMVAGGSGDLDRPQEGTMNLQQLLALLRDADSAKRAELLTEHAELIKEWGLDEAAIGRILDDPSASDDPSGDAPGAGAGEGDQSSGGSGGQGEPAAAAAESYGRGSQMGGLLVREAVTRSGLVAEGAGGETLQRAVETVTKHLPERFTEADLSRVVETASSMRADFEKAQLVPSVPHVEVTVEDREKREERLYQSLCRNWREGYSSIKQAYADLTGCTRFDPFDPDFTAQIVREAWDVKRMPGVRTSESVTSTTWGEALGNTLHRRFVELYLGSPLSDWRKLVRTKPLSDFRQQELVIMGGYGELPTVLEGGTYQPLTTPADVENVYSPSKKGATEDLTFETVQNDDIGAVARIPEAMARSAALTIYRFVFISLISGNPNVVDVDGTMALFHASRNNTTAIALGHAGVRSLRQKMRDQVNPGVSADPLGLTPKYLVVPNELEELAWELCNSDRAIPSTTPGATDVPNLFKASGMEPIVVDHLTDADDWFAVADPSQTDTIEIGFVGGREDPELLMQDDPRVGAVFSADKVTWKIRHMYGGQVANFRAFQRGTQ